MLLKLRQSPDTVCASRRIKLAAKILLSPLTQPYLSRRVSVPWGGSPRVSLNEIDVPAYSQVHKGLLHYYFGKGGSRVMPRWSLFRVPRVTDRVQNRRGR